MSEEDHPGPSKRRKVEKPRTPVLYEDLQRYIATKRQLDQHGFPRPGPNPKQAMFNCSPSKPQYNGSDQKTCVRCKERFVLKQSGKVLGGTCYYHYGRCYDNVGRWTCCGASRTTIGCKTSPTHVHDDNVRNRSGYVRTVIKKYPEEEGPGIFAVDCEMSYTVKGRELTRVSIVDLACNTVYDKYVKPFGRILSYNTEHSGITEKDLEGVKTTLDDVQKFMLEKFSSETILVGHSLDSDFVALRLIHDTVIDTSLVYPHPRGLPHKCALRTLAKKHLFRNVQQGLHDSVEDASACMQLVMRKVMYSY